ncbi:tetratricopeptide repeat protein [Candidatus Thioglobus autotrophicus]|uniref:tetratricopeptide repeat protein n=1 Tax=Candidatus Thioglobus autotrophicus TaxID=1705394 RepID=UPI0006B40506|nr:tetratricopeptide repeat protein [Candidatus Thioglobus autotrophicus]
MKSIIISLYLLLSSYANTSFADFTSAVSNYNKGNYNTAFKEFKHLAEQGNIGAQTNLGMMYEHGTGTPKDYKQAAYWYRMSAKQGGAAAQDSLGVMYANGQGVPKNDKQAVEWFKKSAEQGFANAQHHLGVMYESGGGGLLKDEKQASEWYRKAKEQGYVSTKYDDASIAYEGAKKGMAAAGWAVFALLALLLYKIINVLLIRYKKRKDAAKKITQ